MKKHFFYFRIVLISALIVFWSCTPNNPFDGNLENETEVQFEQTRVSLANNRGEYTDSTAILYGRIVNTMNDNGIVYGIIVHPHEDELRYNESGEIKVYCNDSVGTNGIFSCTIKGLISGTLYEYKAFAQNDIFYIESGLSTFNTTGPKIKVSKVTDNYTESIQLFASASSDQDIINSWGICWGENPLPTYEHDKKITWTDRTYSYYNLSDLKKGTIYYVRAFAFIDNKCRYGAQISFTTPLE